MAPDWSAVDERKWLFVSADVRGAGTRDEPLRTSAWEAMMTKAIGQFQCITILTWLQGLGK